jgi:hypothetical protein
MNADGNLHLGRPSASSQKVPCCSTWIKLLPLQNSSLLCPDPDQLGRSTLIQLLSWGAGQDMLSWERQHHQHYATTDTNRQHPSRDAQTPAAGWSGMHRWNPAAGPCGTQNSGAPSVRAGNARPVQEQCLVNRRGGGFQHGPCSISACSELHVSYSAFIEHSESNLQSKPAHPPLPNCCCLQPSHLLQLGRGGRMH